MKARWVLFLLAACFATSSAFALEGWIVDHEGRPIASVRVAVRGISGWFTADESGRVHLPWQPDPPFVLVAFGPADERFAPVTVAEIPDGRWTITLEPVFAEVINIASETPHVTSSPGAASAVITREETLRASPQSLADAIRQIPGATVVGEGPAAVPAIRGMSKGRTLILIDDGRVMTERRAGPSATFIDPFDLDAIELTRGPGSVAYGSDAMGGVIHLRTRLPGNVSSPEVRARLGTGFGAETMESASAEVLWPTLGGTALLRARYRDLDDYQAADGERVLDSSFRDRGAALRWGGKTALGRLRLGLTIDEGADIGRPSISSEAAKTSYSSETSRRLTLSLEPSSSTFELHASVGTYRLVLDRETPRSGYPQTFERSDVESTDVTLRGQGSYVLGHGLLVAGADFSGRLGLTARTIDETRASDTSVDRSMLKSIADADKTDLGAFLSFDFLLRHGILLSTGLRADWVRAENRTAAHEASRNEVAPSGHVAVTAGPWSGFTATLQLASGFRDPSLSDRYFTGPTARGFIYGNPDLEPERSYQTDFTMQWSGSRGSVSLSAYDYEIDDLIERFRDDGDFYSRNRGSATIRGLELEAVLPWQKGQARVRGVTARGRADDGSALDDVPSTAITVAIDGQVRRVSVGLRATHVFEDRHPGPTEAVREGYTVVDASLSSPLREGLELRLTPQNIFDERYHRASDDSAPVAPGRSVAIQLIASWK